MRLAGAALAQRPDVGEVFCGVELDGLAWFHKNASQSEFAAAPLVAGNYILSQKVLPVYQNICLYKEGFAKEGKRDFLANNLLILAL